MTHDELMARLVERVESQVAIARAREPIPRCVSDAGHTWHKRDEWSSPGIPGTGRSGIEPVGARVAWMCDRHPCRLVAMTPPGEVPETREWKRPTT